jgi:hypothetical protein
MLHKLNGQINALLADFHPVEKGKGDFTAAATPPSVQRWTEECF